MIGSKLGGYMFALKKTNILTIEEFIENYEGTRCQFHEGEIWEAQATNLDHSDFMGSMTEELRSVFHKKGGGKFPGGWWIYPEVAVRYFEKSLFAHDLAGWRRALTPEMPRKFPVTVRPDWVCEILSSNDANDLVRKRRILHEAEVPYYWIVHPKEKIISVLEWSPKGYVSILDVTEGFEGKIPPFDAVVLKANVLFGEEDE
jgi:Uma2 family endonuclease